MITSQILYIYIDAFKSIVNFDLLKIKRKNCISATKHKTFLNPP